MQGAQMATMLQYIVGVSFSMVVSMCHTVSIVYLKSFIPERVIGHLKISHVLIN